MLVQRWTFLSHDDRRAVARTMPKVGILEMIAQQVRISTSAKTPPTFVIAPQVSAAPPQVGDIGGCLCDPGLPTPSQQGRSAAALCGAPLASWREALPQTS